MMNAVPSWLGAGALAGVGIGIISGCWQKIKAVFWRLISYGVAQVEIQDEATANAVLSYLINNYKRSKVYERTYGANYEYTRSDGRYGMIPFEFLGKKSLVFWNGWKPLLFGTAAQQQTNTPAGGAGLAGYAGGGGSTRGNDSKTLTFFRGTFDPEAIIQSACEARNKISWDTTKQSKQKRFFIKKVPNISGHGTPSSYSAGSGIAWYQEGHYRLLQHKPWELGRSQRGGKKVLDHLIFPDRIKKLIREIQIWRNNRDWYIERGVPWKRGWVLYGPPGTGKSVLVRAFAEDEDMPLFVFSLSELMNHELQKSWAEMQSHIPCVALFEDIDNVFHGRNNVAGNNLGLGKILGAMGPPPNNNGGSAPNQPQEQGPKLGMLSFDCLLNCIDGVEKSDGVFTIMTTNDISKIDPALGQPRRLPDGTVEFISSRPGRIDKAIELTYMEPDDKLLMANRILGDCPKGLEQMFEFLNKYPTLEETPAQFQERCSQLALSYFWLEQNGKEDLIGHDAASDIHKRVLSVHPIIMPHVETVIRTEESPVSKDDENHAEVNEPVEERWAYSDANIPSLVNGVDDASPFQ